VQRVLWWLRRDLRLADNTALSAALADAHTVIPVFILDDHLLNAKRTQGYRMAWLMQALHTLDRDLRERGARLIVRRGVPAEQLPRLCDESGAAGVYFNRDYSAYAQRRDQAVRRALTQQGYLVKDFKDLVLHEANEVISSTGKHYAVYTPYRRAWSPLPKPAVLPAPDEMHRLAAPAGLVSEPIPDPALYPNAPEPIGVPGEAEAQRRLSQFIYERAHQYKDQRNQPGIDGTSLLSPYLRWGMISPRTCYAAALHAMSATSDQTQRDNINTWIGELVWREFNHQILARNQHIVTRSFKPAYDHVRWENDERLFECWRTGQTGYPIVDAALRQLNATGWMHNRTRMIAASFLVKDLLIDWRWGERYFMQRLLDGEVANNVGGWQWVAGTGTDAAPYFRVFNPTTQSETYDPSGTYLRRWLPELAAVPTHHLHRPSGLLPMEQQSFGVRIGETYPMPIVDHAEQRERVLALYGAARPAN
jgi:deoxyribodipyrimidine photo-lyase